MQTFVCVCISMWATGIHRNRFNADSFAKKQAIIITEPHWMELFIIEIRSKKQKKKKCETIFDYFECVFMYNNQACAVTTHSVHINTICYTFHWKTPFVLTLFISITEENKFLIVNDQHTSSQTNLTKYVANRLIRRQRAITDSNILFIKYTLTINTCTGTQSHANAHTHGKKHQHSAISE